MEAGHREVLGCAPASGLASYRAGHLNPGSPAWASTPSPPPQGPPELSPAGLGACESIPRSLASAVHGVPQYHLQLSILASSSLLFLKPGNFHIILSTRKYSKFLIVLVAQAALPKYRRLGSFNTGANVSHSPGGWEVHS